MYSSASLRHPQPSPTATMEKGVFRLHSPASARTVTTSRMRQLPSSRHQVLSTYEKRMGLLVVALALATMLCFGSAYYLFSSRWDIHTAVPQGSISDSIQVVEFKRDSEVNIPRDSATKYMAYLPHSGFHNQRIALENALVLARMLNRTLLVPPIRLGNGVIRYFPYERLYDLVARSGKEGMLHCNSPTTWESLPVECYDHFDYTFVPWSWMTNLSSLGGSHDLIYRWNASDAWLRDALHISAEETFSFKDTSPLQYRYVDADPLDFPGTRYKEAVAISLLAQVPHRLLQFGTLFGSSRLRLRRRKNIQARKEIRESMVFTNDNLIRVADDIQAAMGDSYISAHLRLGDGHFLDQSEANARTIWWKLVHETLGISEDAALMLEGNLTNKTSLRPPIFVEDPAEQRSPHPTLSPVSGMPHYHPTCRRPLHTDNLLLPLNIPLFVSTDVREPASNPSLRIFFESFPCTFVLSDFMQELAPLGRLKSGYDGLMLKEFVIPFLDAIVASKGHSLVGTKGSTFSQFAQDVLWRSYHGFEIVQRG